MFNYKRLLFIFIIFLLVLLILFCILFHKPSKNLQNHQKQQTTLSNIDASGTTYNGWLRTNGSKLENEKGEQVQLRGVSSHGINWFSDIINKENLQYLKDNWNINVFRIAVYTSVDGDGYVNHPNNIDEEISKIIDIAVQLDMYVIIDWHTLQDNNPQQFKDQAISFFDKFSKKYSNTPNLIYEICNEPNGQNVTWDTDVKPYAEDLIPIIRKNSPKSLIIVGTPMWCTDLNAIVDNPVKFDNVIYSCHFYSGSHGSELRDKITYCLQSNIPIFISECGLTNAAGNGELYYDEFTQWINFINSNNLSWAYWSFSNKNEASAILKPEYTVDYNIENYLTDSGKFVKRIFQSY